MATEECKVFHGVGAIIGQVTSHTQFSVMAIVSATMDKPTLSEGRLFEVDLNATPRTAGVADWSKVKFDDRGVNASGNEWPISSGPPRPLEITNVGTRKQEELR